MSEMMKQKQGGNDDACSHCPLHPGFMRGLCFLCGLAAAEEAGGGAPATPGGVTTVVGYEVTNQGGGDDDEDDYVDDDDYDDDEEDDAGGSAPGVTVAYIHGEGPVMPAMQAATSIVGASDRATLRRERKLILVLDLDHTLLNSTRLDDLSPVEHLNGITPDTIGDPRVGLFRLDSDDLGMLVKLRPFARGFLAQASAMFEMHVYTLGIRAYARATVAMLDPDGVYIGGRIVSRDESTRPDTKSLDVIRGAEDPAMVVILDDSDDVWPGHLRNLIHMDTYSYFASTYDYEIPSLAERGVDESEHDGSLALVLDVLRRVHRGFFDGGGRADVRDVIAEVRRQVLPGCTLAFSFRDQVMEDFPESSDEWRLAEALGAVCRRDVGEVTHVVAEDPTGEKAQWARNNGKFLVHSVWVMVASFRWRRPDELALRSR